MNDIGSYLDTFGQTIVGLIVVWLLILLLFREVKCWYLKINERLVEMRDQTELLKTMAEAIQRNNKILTDGFTKLNKNNYDSTTIKTRNNGTTKT